MAASVVQEAGRYRRVPPEGGWGLLVGVGMAMMFVVTLGSLPSFGLMFGDFLTELGEETSAIALITSCFFSALSFAGLFTNTLMKKTSCRTVGLIGAVSYIIGSMMTIFVRSTNELLISFAVFQGAGFGLMIPVSYTTFNAYFVEKRVVMMSVAQTLIGLGTMFYPIFIQRSMDAFGFRGCMAVLAAVNSHTLVAMLVMHPVRWHMRRVPVDGTSRVEYGPVPTTATTTGAEEERPTKTEDDFQELPAGQGLCQRNAKLRGSRRASSIPGLGNWSGPVVVSDSTERDTKPATKWQILVDFLDLTLLKDPIYVNIVLGISFALYSDLAFFTLQPMYLFMLSFSKSDVSLIIAIGAGADLISRIFLAISSTCLNIKARYVYLAGALFTIVARFGFLCVFDFYGMAIVTAIMGFLRTWIHVPLPLVFSEYLPQERFPSGYGLFMFLQGNITFAIGPIVGYIRDVTGSYTVSFHCLTLVMALCVIPWFFEICYYRLKRKARKAEPVQNVTIPMIQETKA
ncbi:LOW QUALITY PROTEIN: monocarboxylate transporter 1 [Anopheles stephensi]|uniref:LOW QUALITY PROTEIN: monocarboxylate transporter 1 n=1 Tax=Anopheles stephensi TaxID=30069 RepID=UPI0016587C69|nr:LOW QUALITY PROTEIN: monocarboxylate transporter 1 [Anopheles stephensi]